MERRYFSAERVSGGRATLAGGEAHHLLHVLRATPGTRVVLFDGSGAEFDAEVNAAGRSTVDLAVHERREISRELRTPLTLGVPLPKGDRRRWIVEKAVELGVARLVPLHTGRSTPDRDKHGEKLERYVIEASKQCGRNLLMEIAPAQTWGEWLASADGSAKRWIADPTGEPFNFDALAAATATFAAVGPEGGLTDEELAAARATGWSIVKFGPRILRIETAAVVIAALAAAGR